MVREVLPQKVERLPLPLEARFRIDPTFGLRKGLQAEPYPNESRLGAIFAGRVTGAVIASLISRSCLGVAWIM
jgi:hypothetical protein